MTWIPKAAPKPPGRAPKKVAPRLKKSRLKKINKKRGGHAFPKNVDLDYRAFIRINPCVLIHPLVKGWSDGGPVKWHRCIGSVQACHVKSRGAGGKDVGNLYPGCAAAHDEQHTIGIPAFEHRYNLDLRERAQHFAKLYLQILGGGA